MTVGVLAIATGAVSLWLARAQSTPTTPAPAIAMGLLAVWSAVQSVPLPVALTSFLSPDSARCWTDALTLADSNPPGWVPIGYAPSAAIQEAAKWACYGTLFFAAALVGRARRSAKWAAWVVLLVAAAISVVTIAHGLVAADRLYGLYEPEYVRRGWALSPLLNSNVLAGFLNLGALMGLGLLLLESRSWARAAAAIGVAACVATSLLAGSRGGIAAIGLGLVAFVALCWRWSRRHRRFQVPLIAGVAAVLGGVLFVALAKNTAPLDAARDLTLDKLAIFKWTRPLIEAHWLTGVGRGSFETVFPAFASPDRHTVFSHAENFVLQWAAEWGVPVALAGLAALAVLLRPRHLAPTKDPVHAAIFSALLMTAAQNLVDLATEVPAPMLALCMLSGAAWGASGCASPRWLRPPGWGRAIAGLAMLAGVLVLAMFRSQAAPERKRIHASAHEDADHSEARRGELRSLVKTFPGDPYFPRMLGRDLTYANDPMNLRWIGYSLKRDPTSGRTYLLLAHALHQRGATGQALVALRSAATFDVDIIPDVGRLIREWAPDPGTWASYAPPGANGARLLTALSSSLGAGTPAQLTMLRRALELDAAPAVKIALGRSHLEALERGTQPCDAGARERCLSEVRALVGSVPSASLRDEVVELRARLEVQKGNAAEAEHLLERDCVSPLAGCARTWARLAADRGDIQPVADVLLARACPPSERCARTCEMLADVAAKSEDFSSAAKLLRRAAEQEPSLERWERAGDVAVRAKRHADAVVAFRRASRLASGKKQELLRTKADAERTKLVR
ncbi:MAG: O-antigen ligase family protein [Polyangiaceae bacterium]